MPRRFIAFVLLLILAGSARGQNPDVAQLDPTLERMSLSLQDLARRVGPSVVQIFTTGYMPNPADPRTLTSERHATGSGVILDPDGYIVTNAHVVDGARRVQVRLATPRPTAEEPASILRPRGELIGAQIVGVDLETDLAILKVARTGLAPAVLGDSESLRKAELVVAFGSPLGLENTVTLGVVSATARQLRVEDPMIYIQTDAAVNPGNSGGPLVNTAGEVVGINTLIFSQSGGSEGLSFAAPSNIVRTVFDQIRGGGRVRRGTIGVHAQTLSPILASGLGLQRDWGVLVGDVVPGGPAAQAGLRPGDVVVRLDGKIMENGRQFLVNVYGKPIGKPVRLEVLRNGRLQEFSVEVRERPDDRHRFADLVRPEEHTVERMGILGLYVDPRIVAMFGGLRREQGVVVAAVIVNLLAHGPGLIPGDVIHALNGQTVNDIDQLRRLLDQLIPGDPIVLQVERQGQLQYLSFEAGI
jgi:serine protease Do